MIFMKKGQGNLMVYVITVLIILASAIFVVSRVNVFMEKSKKLTSIDEAKQMLTSLDAVIKELVFEAPGAKRSFEAAMREGTLTVSGKKDEIQYRIASKYAIMEPGTRAKEGPLLITSGPCVSASEKDIDNDGDTDLVIENDIMAFAVAKIGSPSSPAPINTSKLVTYIENKDLGVTINVTDSTIVISNISSTSYGTGYTELVETGTCIDEAAIKVFVNSTKLHYEVLFTLGRGMDFVDMRVKNVVEN